jgi:hypothetical protein
MTLRPDADIEQAIRVGSDLAGRSQIETHVQHQLCQKLLDNWFSSAADIAAMSEDECVSIGFPLGLRNAIANAIVDEVSVPLVAGDSVAEVVVAEADDMEARICPPLDRFGFSISDVPKGMRHRPPPPDHSPAHPLTRSPTNASRPSREDLQILPQQVGTVTRAC